MPVSACFLKRSSLQVHVEVSEQFLLPPAYIFGFSGSSWVVLEACAAAQRQALVCSQRRPVPSGLPALRRRRPSFSQVPQVPREPLLWQIPFGFTGPRGGAVGATWHGPPSSHVQSNLQTALGGSRSPGPRTGRACFPHCLRGSGAFPQLTCLRVARCEKLETKMVSTD